MSEGDPAFCVDGLGKRYRFGERGQYRARRDMLADLARLPFRRRGGGGAAEWMWALRDVSSPALLTGGGPAK